MYFFGLFGRKEITSRLIIRGIQINFLKNSFLTNLFTRVKMYIETDFVEWLGSCSERVSFLCVPSCF